MRVTVSDVVAIANGQGGGVRLVLLDRICEAATAWSITTAVTRLGFVCVRAGDVFETLDLRALVQRHVVVICDTPGAQIPAIGLVRRLALASPRRHLVICMGKAERWLRQGRLRAAERWFGAAAASARRHGDDEGTVLVEVGLCARLIEAGHGARAAKRLRALLRTADLSWTQYVDAAVCLADATIAAGEFHEADAWLHSVETEATIRGEAVPASLLERRAQLDAKSRVKTERTTMLSVDELGRLLNVLEEAPDEVSALTAGCAWVRRWAEDVNVAVVSADGVRLFASHGWRPIDLPRTMAAILEGPDRDLRFATSTTATGGFAISVRYGAATVAHVVVGPGCEHRAGLLQATQALAMLIGPAARACLDAFDARGQERDGLREILGRSQAMVDVRIAIARAAATGFPVLVEGESGTGKELVARAVHRLSARRDRRFLAVNCAALTDDLVESELFGHARGAFTGAIGPRAGLFEEAHGGTLFLDEVAELSPRAQAKLLRVLQEREVRRVGESAMRAVDVRVVTATNVPMAEAVARGRFRDDLRFRLAVVPIRLPALRERLEDLPLLAHVFWRRALGETGKRAFLGPDALVQLTRHHWPGNVRELQNVIAGLAVAAPTSGRVTGRHVAQVLQHVSGAGPDESARALPLEAARKVFERRLVASTLARHAGRRSAAAQDLGLTRQGLSKALRRLGLSEDEDAAGVA